MVDKYLGRNCVLCVNDLIRKGIDINHYMIKGRNTFLHIAAKTTSKIYSKCCIHNIKEDSDGTDYIIFLINKGALLNDKNIFGNTPLHCAVLCGNVQCIKILLKYGANQSICNYNSETPRDYCKRTIDVSKIEKIIQIFDDFNLENMYKEPNVS